MCCRERPEIAANCRHLWQECGTPENILFRHNKKSASVILLNLCLIRNQVFEFLLKYLISLTGVMHRNTEEKLRYVVGKLSSEEKIAILVL